jgi:hypothetical protein
MFPIAIVAGVIGAAVSSAQGASWLQDHLGASGDASSVGSKSDAKPQGASAGVSPSFQAALAAQVTGQSVPTTAASTAPTGSSVASIPQTTSYDMLARTKAGIAAYSQSGEHHNGHAKTSDSTADDRLITQS